MWLDTAKALLGIPPVHPHMIPPTSWEASFVGNNKETQRGGICVLYLKLLNLQTIQNFQYLNCTVQDLQSWTMVRHQAINWGASKTWETGPWKTRINKSEIRWQLKAPCSQSSHLQRQENLPRKTLKRYEPDGGLANLWNRCLMLKSSRNTDSSGGMGPDREGRNPFLEVPEQA